jgi:hypothetical protein
VSEKISSTSVTPAEIFSTNISTASNVVVNPSVENNRLVYHLEVPQATAIYKANVAPQPIISLDFDQPVEIRAATQTIVVNNEQAIDYSGVSSQASEAIPPVETRIGSASSASAYTVSVAPESAFVNLNFATSGGKSTSVPVHSDVKIENRTFYLVENDKDYLLKVSPQEIYSGSSGGASPTVYSSGEVKSVSLGMESQRPVYSVNTSEDFNLLWIIPMKIDSQYSIDGSSGAVIREEKPWFAFLGSQ